MERNASFYTEYFNKPLRERWQKHRVLIVLIAFFVILAGLYGYGYRIGPGFSFNRVGTLTLTNLPQGTLVYADQTLKSTVRHDGDVKLELVRGSHDIIVAAPNDFPWSDLAPVSSGINTVVNPILVGRKPNAMALEGDEKAAAFSAVASTTLPTRDHPLHLDGGCAVVYVENNRVLADATTTAGSTCTTPAFLCTGPTCTSTIIFAPTEPMAAVIAFPGRQDALVIQLGHIIYALALDPRNPQFFAPILTGVNPQAGVLPDGTVVVRNNTAAYKLKL